MDTYSIENVRYSADTITRENISIEARINGTEMTVPLDPDNKHYQAIQEWVKEGNKIEDAD